MPALCLEIGSGILKPFCPFYSSLPNRTCSVVPSFSPSEEETNCFIQSGYMWGGTLLARGLVLLHTPWNHSDLVSVNSSAWDLFWSKGFLWSLWGSKFWVRITRYWDRGSELVHDTYSTGISALESFERNFVWMTTQRKMSSSQLVQTFLYSVKIYLFKHIIIWGKSMKRNFSMVTFYKPSHFEIFLH